MSEIYDFLKKTESEQKWTSSAPREISVVEPEKETRASNDDSVIIEPLPVEAEICGAEKFDLTQASQQFKNVLNPSTLFGEQFRMLRSRLGIMQKQRGIKTILVTSSVPEEGKTFTASCLAGVFAQEAGKRVVLIDADMRKPRSGIHFGLNGSSGSAGLSEVLRETQEFDKALFKSMNPEFSFMPSGPLPLNPSELLSSPILEQVLKNAAGNYDWIIIDSPPVLSLSDTILLAPLCDTVVLVVRAGSTPIKLIQDSINRVGRDRICGIILNRQKQLNTSSYYYNYYYHGSKRKKH
jgi:protein-tyrosine kinase